MCISYVRLCIPQSNYFGSFYSLTFYFIFTFIYFLLNFSISASIRLLRNQPFPYTCLLLCILKCSCFFANQFTSVCYVITINVFLFTLMSLTISFNLYFFILNSNLLFCFNFSVLHIKIRLSQDLPISKSNTYSFFSF